MLEVLRDEVSEVSVPSFFVVGRVNALDEVVAALSKLVVSGFLYEVSLLRVSVVFRDSLLDCSSDV